ncbi:MAG: AMP-binding protein [Rhodococcus sp. (in: high G+C Gram-positive bacteria)]|uniref:class I adenylate-forming enzyme family protein n=1 Tax=Rhodococcus sp. TaxID=1831 RepID=UPI003BB10D23
MLHAKSESQRSIPGLGASSARTLTAEFAGHAASQPTKVAVVDDNRTVSYAELAELTEECRQRLVEYGIGRGDAVAWQLPNSVEAVALFLACVDLGAVAVPIVPIFRENEVEFICAQTRAAVLIVPAEHPRVDYPALAHTVAGRVDTLRMVGTVSLGEPRPFGTGTTASGRSPINASESANADERVSVIVYTSGTESRPKGVMHSQHTLIYDSDSMCRYLDMTADDVFFMPSPLSHITGLLNGIIGPVLLGATAVLQDKWDPARALELIRTHRCTYSVMATPFLQQMFARPDAADALQSFRFIRCGGADIPATLMDTAARFGVTVLRVYGLSELPTLTCTHPDSSAAQRAGTDGRILENVTLRIVDDADRELPPGAVGHILASGPEMFLGYVDPSLDATAFTTDGLFRTGDLGTLDADGYLRITGRAKDVIVRGGENLSALEIEEALREHPSIVDVAVVGVPDDVMGQRACAFVVTADDAAITIADLRAAIVGAGLAVQKAPEYVLRVASLPRTPSGKVRKNALTAEFAERTTSVPRTTDHGETA